MHLFLVFLFLIEGQLIYNVVLISNVQQSDLVIYIYINTHMYIVFQILFHYRLLQDINIVPCAITRSLLFVYLYTAVCICYSQTPNLSLPPLVTISLFSMSGSRKVVEKITQMS